MLQAFNRNGDVPTSVKCKIKQCTINQSIILRTTTWSIYQTNCSVVSFSEDSLSRRCVNRRSLFFCTPKNLLAYKPKRLAVVNLMFAFLQRLLHMFKLYVAMLVIDYLYSPMINNTDFSVPLECFRCFLF